MTRTTRTGRRPARGSFGQWSTEDRTGHVREHRGWDAALLAVIDGGGCLRPTHHTDPDTATGDAAADGAAGDDSRRRTTSRRSTARTTRKGGRR